MASRCDDVPMQNGGVMAKKDPAGDRGRGCPPGLSPAAPVTVSPSMGGPCGQRRTGSPDSVGPVHPPAWSRPGEAVGLFLHGATARTAGPTAALVGTVLSAVNQASVIVTGHATGGTWLRVAVSYTVPYVVASAGFLSARRERPDRGDGAAGTGTAGRGDHGAADALDREP